MSKPIYVINGPNLNRLGLREPEIYGYTTLVEVESICRDSAGDSELVFRQSNSECELIEWIHEAIDNSSGMLINPAAFTFTSMAIMDALKMYPFPLIEFHISNVHKREPMYHSSLVSPIATAIMVGTGARGYGYAVRLLRDMIAERA
ncbi:type II 3-dehydroquinate dehydratase [Halomonas urumqiensis]|uniref:3-dehydroquinate dehydratase n=1 Tax=Halomonas urumqiensis TaxID=1684789 RepID=A0A2N7UNJ2_9GAMM|nr:type II 3-dehydroquinate dehydratase [Halomonas urumqiensis]PMR82014.1 3-dehydroquinate dehydratase [Halomonas urumqiensis]PTB02654.1 3-dehydroquinate dehydratase [Halomonas urumqiensis]GHE21140.1 3-dehydroquinate dehydratase [Halomonas urumqiensis]